MRIIEEGKFNLWSKSYWIKIICNIIGKKLKIIRYFNEICAEGEAD